MYTKSLNSAFLVDPSIFLTKIRNQENTLTSHKYMINDVKRFFEMFSNLLMRSRPDRAYGVNQVVCNFM